VGSGSPLPVVELKRSILAKHSRPWLATIGRGLLLLAAGAGLAIGQELTSDRQVLILSRALAYDSNLKSRAGDDLVVGVLGKAGNGPSEDAASAMARAFRSLISVRVQGLPVRTVQLAYTTAGALAFALETRGVDVLYLVPGLDDEIPAIAELARRRHVVTMGSRQEQVARGLSLGVFAVEGKPTIVVNLTASKAEGASFGSDLLRLAKVIR
jgi:YfiR/HmsC-like